MKCRIACRGVVEDGMIQFAAYTAAEIPNFFSWPDNPQIVPSRGDLGPI